MSEQDRREEPPAPGNWRVTAQPMAAAPARPQGLPSSPAVVPGSSAPAPAKAAGRPLLATLICAGVLFLWLASKSSIHPRSGVGPAYFVGVALAGAIFGAILWGIAFAITIRKASRRWKAVSLMLLAMLGAVVALAKVVSPGAAAPAPLVQVPVVHQGK